MTQELPYPMGIVQGGVSLCVFDAILQYFLKASMICFDSFTILENGCTPILLQPTFGMANEYKKSIQNTPL